MSAAWKKAKHATSVVPMKKNWGFEQAVDDYDAKAWVRILFRGYGSVFGGILSEVFTVVVVTIVACFVYYYTDLVDRDAKVKKPLLDKTAHGLATFPLAFLVIFRTNQAYSRWAESRGHIGSLVMSCRHIGRITLGAVTGEKHKNEIIRLTHLIFDMVLIDLKDDPDNHWDALKERASEDEQKILEPVKGQRPLTVAFWITTYVEFLRGKKLLGANWVRVFDLHVRDVLNAHAGCMKIKGTPIPFPYAQLIQYLLLIYLFALPFTVVHIYGWWTILVVIIASVFFFGINEVALQIEKPFGDDPNDHKMEKFGRQLHSSLEYMHTLDDEEKIPNVVRALGGGGTKEFTNVRSIVDLAVAANGSDVSNPDEGDDED